MLPTIAVVAVVVGSVYVWKVSRGGGRPEEHPKGTHRNR